MPIPSQQDRRRRGSVTNVARNLEVLQSTGSEVTDDLDWLIAALAFAELQSTQAPIKKAVDLALTEKEGSS